MNCFHPHGKFCWTACSQMLPIYTSGQEAKLLPGPPPSRLPHPFMKITPNASLEQHDPDLSFFSCCQLCPVSRRVAGNLANKTHGKNEISETVQPGLPTHVLAVQQENGSERVPSHSPGKGKIPSASLWMLPTFLGSRRALLAPKLCHGQLSLETRSLLASGSFNKGEEYPFFIKPWVPLDFCTLRAYIWKRNLIL